MRQKLGQHFLINPEISERIAAALDLAAGDTIVEVGPGHGELTQAIVAEAEKRGAKDVKLIAIEKDTTLVEELRQIFEKKSGAEIIEGDILKDLGPTSDKLKGGYKIVGNIPYYLTGHLLRLIGELKRPPTLTIVMIQKEVAERLAAQPPRMNRLAAAVQFWAEPQLLCQVPRTDFDPAPEVDSAVITLKTKAETLSRGVESAASAEHYYAVVRALFQQPRKTIANNLAASDLNLQAALKDLKIEAGARPQDLTVEQIKTLARELA